MDGKGLHTFIPGEEINSFGSDRGRRRRADEMMMIIIGDKFFSVWFPEILLIPERWKFYF